MSLLHRQLLAQFVADIEEPAARVIEAVIAAANPVAGAAAAPVLDVLGSELKKAATVVAAAPDAPAAAVVEATITSPLPPSAAPAASAPAVPPEAPAASAPAVVPPASALPTPGQAAALDAVKSLQAQLATLATQLAALETQLAPKA